MRGIRTQGNMRTSVMRGLFRDEPETRAELLNLIAARH
jgi:GTP cyclohydrolase I